MAKIRRVTAPLWIFSNTPCPNPLSQKEQKKKKRKWEREREREREKKIRWRICSTQLARFLLLFALNRWLGSHLCLHFIWKAIKGGEEKRKSPLDAGPAGIYSHTYIYIYIYMASLGRNAVCVCVQSLESIIQSIKCRRICHSSGHSWNRVVCHLSLKQN